jgi:uncharacterized membrane protein
MCFLGQYGTMWIFLVVHFVYIYASSKTRDKMYCILFKKNIHHILNNL